MWPLTGAEVVAACRGKCDFTALDSLLVRSVTTDSRKIEAQEMFVAVKGEKFDGHDFVKSALERGATLALVSAGWTGRKELPKELVPRCVVVDDVLQAFRGLAAFMRFRFPFPVIGIGGSNGKTTTKEMLAALLSGGDYRVTKTTKSENGYLGLAVTLNSKTHATRESPHALVLEIGIDAKGAMSEHVCLGNPDIVLLTALGPEHLAGLDNWETAVAEEYKLFQEVRNNTKRIWQCADEKLIEKIKDVRAGDVVVCEKSEIARIAKLATKESVGSVKAFLSQRVSVLEYKVTKTSQTESHLEVEWHPTFGERASGAVRFVVPLPGIHNAQNFALALATVLSLGRTLREATAGWATFTPPEMRSRVVTLKNGLVLYDDCYNASPTSMKAAFEVFKSVEWRDKRKVAVLGDMLDLGSESKKWHLELVTLMKDLRNTHLCFYGEAMYDVYQAIKSDMEFVTGGKNAVSFLPRTEEPSKFLSEVRIENGVDVLLVKGSRGMDLGRVVKAVTEKIGV